jgi:hypothetical protein
MDDDGRAEMIHDESPLDRNGSFLADAVPIFFLDAGEAVGMG